MKILIYIPNISQSNGGLRQYAVTLLRMLQNDSANKYYIYHDLRDPEVIDAITYIPRHMLVTTTELKESVVRKQVKDHITNFINRFFKKEVKVDTADYFTSYCKNENIEVIHCICPIFPYIDNIKFIATLHDVQELHFPEFFTAEERADRASKYLYFLRRADFVVVSYDHIKKDLIKYFNVPGEKIKTVLLQMENLWFQKFSEEDILKLPNNLESKKYLLYPANAWKHKNHLKLLESVAFLRDQDNLKINLVFTGDFENDHGSTIFQKTKELQLENQIVFLGIVEEMTLFSLYKKATGVVIPTLYEAGSFPLMESIFLGIPVICSNVTSLPETIGNSEFIFDPTDLRSIASCIKSIYLNKEFRSRSLENSRLQKQKLKQNHSLSIVKGIYDSLNKEQSFA